MRTNALLRTLWLLVALGVAAPALGQSEAESRTSDPAAQPPPDTGTLAPPPPSTAALPVLISGAPLNDANVAVHVVEKKAYPDKGRLELVFYPAVPQLNTAFTQHAGTALSLVYHVQENLGLFVSPLYNWYNANSGFNAELNTALSAEARPASSLLMDYGAVAGVEVAPLYGKFAFYNGALVRFSVLFNGGAGVVVTRHELREGTRYADSTFGETGPRFLGQLGGGFRFQIGERFSLRLELKDLVYTGRVDRVNGCSGTDLQSLIDAHNGAGGTAGSVSSTCNASSFTGKNPLTGYDRSNDLVSARDLTLEQYSAVLNNLGFYAGFGFVF